MTQLQTNEPAPDFTANNVYGGELNLKQLNAEGKSVLLAFHRYASCPICNFSLRQFTTRHDELAEKNIVYLPIFHSSVENMLEAYAEQPPYPIIADPDMKLYKLYGLKPSLGAFFHPKALKDGAKAIHSWMQPDFKFKIAPEKTMLTKPADFLINPKGEVQYLHYGVSIGDSVGIDEVLANS